MFKANEESFAGFKVSQLKLCLIKTLVKLLLFLIRFLESAIALQKTIKEDFYIVPYAIVEIALIHIDEGRPELAMNCLEDAKKNYTGYSLESRLHFRIHTAQTDLHGSKDYITGVDE